MRQTLHKINASSKRKSLQEKNITENAAAYILSITDHEIKRLRGKDTAEALHIERDLLNGLFKKNLRLSLAGFIQREKLYRAISALENEPDISIKSLAERLGFPTLHDFKKAFAALILMSPGRYKKLIKKRRENSL